MQMVSIAYGVPLASFVHMTFVHRVAHGAGGVLVRGDICHGHWIQLQIIQVNMNAVPYREMVVHFVHQHITCQNDNAQPHVPRFCIQYMEAVNIPALQWPPYSTDIRSIVR